MLVFFCMRSFTRAIRASDLCKIKAQLAEKQSLKNESRLTGMPSFLRAGLLLLRGIKEDHAHIAFKKRGAGA